ncbi:MAG TPA: chemotaxis response regulator protein-glutamate methylesterase [Thermoanaerobaculia bacterium]
MSADLHVLIVDDSAVVRQTILAILRTQPDIRTTIAADPLIAMERMKRDRPDVIILDLEMPRMDGITFLRKLMRETPTPVIVCSSHIGDGGAQAVRALQAGAVELIGKPTLGVQSFLNESALLLIDAVRAAAAARLSIDDVTERRRGSVARGERLRSPESPAGEDAARPAGETPALRERREASLTLGMTGARPQVIAIGASTGGTEAIREILDALPATSCGVVIVQHMPEMFTRSFANHLNDTSALSVKEAEAGDEVLPGRALVAPGNHHLTVNRLGPRLFVDVTQGPLVSRHRPSVDVLFRSVAAAAGPQAIGVILTGMGADGAAGMLDLHQSGAHTIAQNEATCAVFGMPNEAIRRGGVREVLPLGRIAGALSS